MRIALGAGEGGGAYSFLYPAFRDISRQAAVDACGIVSHFQRMNRIVDGTDRPLEPVGVARLDAKRLEMNEKMGIHDYRSCANTLAATDGC